MASDSQSPSVPGDPESPGGFKTFWRKATRESRTQSLTFVPQNPGASSKSGRIRRLWKGAGGSEATTDETQSSSPGDPQKRRQQVYLAQKRHRNRKAEYVQSLEEEVARLQHLKSVVNNERDTLAHQNQAIREFLISQSFDIQLAAMDLSSSPHASSAGRSSSNSGSASVDIRFDPEMDHERTFLDLDQSSMQWTSTVTSDSHTTSAPTPSPGPAIEPVAVHRPVEPVTGDSWAALDFILALEWPCRNHVHHTAISPPPAQQGAPDPEALNGHALTVTAAVLQSALPPPPQAPQTAAAQTNLANVEGSVGLGEPSLAHSSHWQLPHAEIEKLVKLSQDLQLDDDILTPAQVYSAVRAHVPNQDALRPVLEALKKPLGSLMKCHGFGASVETEMFWQHLSEVLQCPVETLAPP